MYQDFYTSLHRHGRDKSHLQTLHEGGYVGTPKLLPIYERLYNDHFAHAPTSLYLIPKKIHQIWLGSELPDRYVSYAQTWAAAEGWEYRLWTDADVEKIVLHNRDLYQLGKNYGEKSDILRLEILYQEGGLYLDVDTQCLNIDFFDQVHRRLTFYAGFEPLEHSIKFSKSQQSYIIGAEAGLYRPIALNSKMRIFNLSQKNYRKLWSL